MATTKTAYTTEQTTALVEAYKASPTADTVADFANRFGKSVKSVVAKLSREGVYQKKVYVSKTGAPVQKKDTTADAIGAILQLSEADVDSLTKANKRALEAIFKALANSRPM